MSTKILLHFESSPDLNLLEKKTKPLKIRAYFAPINRVPIIVGLESLLDKSDVFFNISKNYGYIEVE